MNNLGYISVDKLIGFANNHINKTIDANDIVRFPRADVEEVRHGKPKLNRGDSAKRYYCPFCYEYLKPENHYCPNCGAKMDGGKDSIDTTT